jgi:hypothetical protein
MERRGAALRDRRAGGDQRGVAANVQRQAELVAGERPGGATDQTQCGSAGRAVDAAQRQRRRRLDVPQYAPGLD